MITPPDIQPIGLSLIYKVPPCSRVEPCRYSRLAVGGLWKQKTPETLISEAYFLAGTEGAFANTLPPDFKVTDSLIQSMIDLARGMQKLGVRDVNGTLTYEDYSI